MNNFGDSLSHMLPRDSSSETSKVPANGTKTSQTQQTEKGRWRWVVGRKDNQIKCTAEKVGFTTHTQQIESVFKQMKSDLETAKDLSTTLNVKPEDLDKLSDLVNSKVTHYKQKHTGKLGAIYKFFRKLVYGDIERLGKEVVNKIVTIKSKLPATSSSTPLQQQVGNQQIPKAVQVKVQKPPLPSPMIEPHKEGTSLKSYGK